MKAQIVTYAIAALAVLSSIALALSSAPGFPELPTRHSTGSPATHP